MQLSTTQDFSRDLTSPYAQAYIANKFFFTKDVRWISFHAHVIHNSCATRRSTSLLTLVLVVPWQGTWQDIIFPHDSFSHSLQGQCTKNIPTGQTACPVRHEFQTDVASLSGRLRPPKVHLATSNALLLDWSFADREKKRLFQGKGSCFMTWLRARCYS